MEACLIKTGHKMLRGGWIDAALAPIVARVHPQINTGIFANLLHTEATLTNFDDTEAAACAGVTC